MAKDLGIDWQTVEDFDIHDCGTPLVVKFGKGQFNGQEANHLTVMPLVVDGVPRCVNCWSSPQVGYFDLVGARMHAATLREGLQAEHLAF